MFQLQCYFIYFVVFYNLKYFNWNAWEQFELIFLEKDVGNTLNGNMREQKKSNKKMQVKQFRKYF